MIELIEARNNYIDSKFILDTRNNIDVRKFSINKKKISKKEHEKWYKTNLNRNVFIIKNKNKKIGYIRFDNKKIPTLSWAILKNFRGNNFGSISLKKILNKIKFHKCFVKINEDNIPSLLMVIKNNFKFKKKKNNFIILEYKKK
jgi:hypothetical protein